MKRTAKKAKKSRKSKKSRGIRSVVLLSKDTLKDVKGHLKAIHKLLGI